MNARFLLVLDFDGVVCDSLSECFASSWIAYHTLLKGEKPSCVPLDLLSKFARLRPFIRMGEDYVLIQEILESAENVKDQAGFDERIERAGLEKMTTYRTSFYKAREELLASDKAYWLSLNRIYPHMLAVFSGLPPAAPVHILSTKKPRFIAEILEHAGIRMGRDRIHESGASGKLARVEKLLEPGDFDRAALVDDQIDHLRGNVDPRIEIYLASWGYVKPQWLDGEEKIPVMSADDLVALVRKEYS